MLFVIYLLYININNFGVHILLLCISICHTFVSAVDQKVCI